MGKQMNKYGLAALMISAGLACAGCEKEQRQAPTPTPMQSYRDTDTFDYSTVSATTAEDFDNKAFMLILDTSGSMSTRIGNESKISIERKAVLGVLEECREYAKEFPGFQAGIITFVGDQPETLVPMQRFDYEMFRQNVENLSLTGGTPLGRSLALAERELDRTGIQKKFMLLATDGENEDGKDPYEIREQIWEENNKAGEMQTEISFIGINMDKHYFERFKARGDVVFTSKNARDIKNHFRSYTAKMILEKEDDPTISYGTSN